MSENEKHIEDRLSAVETHLAHMESTIGDLSDMVRRQWDALDRIEKTVKRLNEEIIEIEDALDGPTKGDAPPPHY